MRLGGLISGFYYITGALGTVAFAADTEDCDYRSGRTDKWLYKFVFSWERRLTLCALWMHVDPRWNLCTDADYIRDRFLRSWTLSAWKIPTMHN